MKRLLLLTILAHPIAAAAPARGQAPGNVKEIVVLDASTGKPAAPELINLVKVRIKSEAGKPYSRRTASEDLDRLRDVTGVGSGFEFNENTGTLTFRIVALPVLREVRIVGHRRFSESDVLGHFKGISPGVRIDEGAIIRGRDSLRREYVRENHYFAEVRYDVDELRLRRRLVIRISEGPRVRVTRVSFEGLRAVPEDNLRATAATRPRLWPLHDGRLDDETLDLDERRLLEYLRGRGHLNARVGRRLNWLDAGKTEVEVVFSVYEGVRFKVGKVHIRIEKAAGEPAAVYTPEQLRERLRTREGAYLSRQTLEDDEKAVKDAYGETGRWGMIQKSDGTRDFFGSEIRVARTAPRDQGVDDKEFVDVEFSIKEHPRIEIGRIDVINNRNVRNRVVLRTLRWFGLTPGEALNGVSLRDAVRELESLPLFAPTPERPFGVRIEPVRPRGGERDVLDLIVDVNERPQTGSISFGAGFSTNLGLVGNITYTDRNFDIADLPDHWSEILSNLIPGRSGDGGRPFTGAGEEFRIEIRPGIEFLSGRVAWRTPYFQDRGFSAGVDLYGEQRAFNSEYSDFRAGASFSVGRRLGSNWRVEATLRPELIICTIRGDDVNVLPNPPPAPPPNGDDRALALLKSEGTFLETRLILHASMDNRRREGSDRIAAYSAGDILSLVVQPSFGTRQYVETDVTYQRLWTVRTDIDGGKDVLSLTGKAGVMFGNVPVFDRFYAGGTGSLRGFDFRTVSPRDGPRHDAVGGKFLLLGSAEYSVPLIHGEDVIFRGFGFVDVGTVERRPEIHKLRLSVGPGIRVGIPRFLGPALFEIGWGIPILQGRHDQIRGLFFTAGFQF